MLSMISLSDMNALCVPEIRFGRRGFKRFARTFAINLYSTLLKLIGLKSVTHRGLCTFGMRFRKVWLRFARMVPKLRAISIAS